MADTVLASLADSTLKQYHNPLKTWNKFCSDFKKDDFNPTPKEVLHFLHEIKIRGASYGTLNTYRSAISLVSKNKIGDDPLISRFMKGVFRMNPIKPKYNATWDVSIVLEYIKNQAVPESSLTKLSEKLAILLLLTTGQRLQTIQNITIESLRETRDGFWTNVTKILKTTRPGSASTLLFLPKFTKTPELCVFSAIKEYLQRTENLRGKTK